MRLPQRIANSAYWTSLRIQRKSEIQKRLEFLLETQWYTPSRLAELQLDKLRRLVHHCYESVPHYRKVMSRKGIRPEHVQDFEAFRKLPLLTREDLRDHKAALLSTTADVRHLHTRYSSGSTGVRAEFVQDNDFDMWTRAHQLRTYSWCNGWNLGEPFMLLWGAPMYVEMKSWRERLENKLSNRIELSSFQLDPQSLETLLAAVVRFRPKLISGYTTALYLLARLAREKGVRPEGLRAVQPNAEPMTETMRQEMENSLGCPVFDKYGSRESNIVAHESPLHQALCIQAEHTYVEFLHESGRPCDVGETGKIVLTTLNNYAMPLLRYETSDLASPLGGNCGSGIGLPRMSHVQGRLQDVLCTPNGGLIHPQLFSNIMRLFDEIVWFQVIQQKEEELLVRICANDEFLQQSRNRITALICEKTGFPFKIHYEILREMPKFPTGKFRLCVCEVAGREIALEHLNGIRTETGQRRTHQ